MKLHRRPSISNLRYRAHPRGYNDHEQLVTCAILFHVIHHTIQIFRRSYLAWKSKTTADPASLNVAAEAVSTLRPGHKATVLATLRAAFRCVALPTTNELQDECCVISILSKQVGRQVSLALVSRRLKSPNVRQCSKRLVFRFHTTNITAVARHRARGKLLSILPAQKTF